MGKHALLSASKANMWLNCPPSIKASENIPDATSEYAKEGTRAHALGELNLRLFLKQITKKQYDKKKKEVIEDNVDMLNYIEGYSDFVIERLGEAKKKTNDAKLEIEVKVDFSKWVPKGFGTADAVIIADDCIEIIDLKYGQGVSVSAENNPQLKLYALGVLDEYSILYDIKQISMTIYQPRLDNISTFTIAVDELISWANEYVKPRAEMAFKGEGEFEAGEHCRFCKIRSTCRKRAEENLKLAQYDFRQPATLSNDEVAKILVQIDDLVSWSKDIKEYALSEAIKGVKFDGFKLVEGRSNRKYVDENTVASALEGLGFKEEEIYSKSLLTITSMEKLLGKKRFEECIGNYIIKPDGKPVLVAESDKRTELNTLQEAIEDFKN